MSGDQATPTTSPRDITDWRSARRYTRNNSSDREVLDALERQLAGLQIIDAAVWVFDAERCQCLWANPPGLAIWRAQSVQELQARDIASTQSEAVYALLNDYLVRVHAGETIANWVTLDPQGTTRRCYQTHHPLVLLDGRSVLLIEAQAEPPAEEMLAFASNHTLTIGLYELDGTLLSGNPPFMRLAEYSPLRDLTQVMPPTWKLSNWPSRLAEQSTLQFEAELNTARGPRWFRCELRRVLTHGRQPRAVVTLFDLTETRLAQAEMERKQAIEDYRVLVESLDEVVFSIGQNGELTFVNGAIERYGMSSDEVLDTPFVDLAHPDDRDRLREAIVKMFALGTSLALEFRLLDANQVTRWIHLTARPLLSDSGVIEATGVLTDMTQQREMAAQLRVAQKMEAMGQLAGGVAHDFNNLLTVILASAELAKFELPQDSPIGDTLNDITDAGTTAAELTRQLLAFSRRQVLQPETLDLRKLLQQSGRMLRRLISEQIEFVVQPAEVLGAIRADRSQIEQLVMNLVINARDALSSDGKIVLSASNVRTPSPSEPGGPRDQVVISVTDNGVGMSQEVVDRMFEPFYTTKEMGEGTGLGLAMVQGIVHQSGGTIQVQSTLGEGTCIEVFFPRHDGQAAPVRDTPQVDHQGGTILVIEDEAVLRDLVGRVLTQAGYTVLVAEDPWDAIAICEREGPEIDLVLTDVVMPGLSGPQLVARVQHLIPNALVIFMSGYSADAFIDEEARQHPVIQKPFDAGTLTQKIHQLLAQPR